MQDTNLRLDFPSRVLHLGLAVIGTWAWWIGEDAGDYHKPVHDGYTLHMWVGMVFSSFLAARLLWGFFGPEAARFSTWVPYTRERFEQVRADVRTLMKFRMPDPIVHRGLNAAVQSLGLVLFTWQGLSGTLMSMLLVPGQRAVGWLHEFKEIHQWSQFWIPTYLALHVGATVLHAFTGKQIWKKMVFLER